MLLGLVYAFVDLFVVCDTVFEISCRFLGILTFIVGGSGLNFHDVSHDEIFIVTSGLDKYKVNVRSCKNIVDPSTSLFC